CLSSICGLSTVNTKNPDQVFQVIIILFSVVGFLCLLIVILFCIRRTRPNLFKRSINASTSGKSRCTNITVNSSISGDLDITAMRRLPASTSNGTKFEETCFDPIHPIAIADIEMLTRKMQDSNGFTEEFEDRRPCRIYSVESGTQNESKNRYQNILAYDHTRVILKNDNGSTRSDYINANYIDGYKSAKKYIATQGPLQETMNDFWRMVHQEKSSCIVMLTNLTEGEKEKCYKYWPDTEAIYDDILVIKDKQKDFALFVERQFRISSTKSPTDFKVVRQFHFTAWPDVGIPSDTVTITNLINRINAACGKSKAPIICHCSAGVGRSGVYIVIDAMLEMLKDIGKIDVAGFLAHIRSQRQHMVQTEEQYAFIYDVIVEAIGSEKSEIALTSIPNYVSNLNEEHLERELQNIKGTWITKSSTFIASTPNCVHKNRYKDIIPYDHNRVLLQSRENKLGNNYINASYINSYKKVNRFILTQNPLENTIEDFWTLVWEQKVEFIIMLSDRTECIKYWAEEDIPIVHDDYHIDYIETTQYATFFQQKYKITCHNENLGTQTRLVYHFRFKSWPTEPNSGAVNSVMEFVTKFIRLYLKIDAGLPIILHSDDGSTRCGTFCGIFNGIEMIETDNVLDMQAIMKCLYAQRCKIISSTEELKLIYSVLGNYIKVNKL
ncbi:Receptor-type tyrosine-protein phosphatase epsilon, partial [Trichoplax sp. H2]